MKTTKPNRVGFVSDLCYYADAAENTPRTTEESRRAIRFAERRFNRTVQKITSKK